MPDAQAGGDRPLVEVAAAELIATVALDRPEAHNALSMALCEALLAALERLAGDPAVRAVVLEGRGPSFCAGADLKERRGKPGAWVRRHNRGIAGVTNALAAFPQPVVAALHGHALGGGAEIALACDLRVAAEGTRIGFPEATLGIIPGAGGTQRLPRLVGPAVAKALIFTGRRLEADEALRVGLVSEVVPHGQAGEAARALARRIAASAPLAVAAAKQAIDHGLDSSLAAGLALEYRSQTALYASADWREGLAAFAEKRPAQFRGE
jgi:enoyl-CoA hydratase/carnithine racemase